MDGALAGLRVLAAEDNAPSLELVMTLVRLAGGTPTGVTNGREAVERHKANGFDVILMDVQMPVLDGLSATRAIRDTEFTDGRHTPILGVTAHAMSEHVQLCLDAGMDAVITKPIEPGTFACTVREHVDRLRTL